MGVTINYKKKSVFELNCIGFRNYLKQFPPTPDPNVGTPIKDELRELIGRETTYEELKKYIQLVVMPIGNIYSKERKLNNLIRLINKNDKEKQTRRLSYSDQLHVS